MNWGRAVAKAVIGIVVSLTLVIVVSFAGYMLWLKPGYKALAFTEKTWLLADPEHRGHMVSSLLAHHDLRGLSQPELLQLLGQPDSIWTVEEAWARDAKVGTEEQLQEWYGSRGPEYFSHVTYRLGYMGFRRGAPFVFSYTLHIEFRDGHVSRAYVDD